MKAMYLNPMQSIYKRPSLLLLLLLLTYLLSCYEVWYSFCHSLYGSFPVNPHRPVCPFHHIGVIFTLLLHAFSRFIFYLIFVCVCAESSRWFRYLYVTRSFPVLLLCNVLWYFDCGITLAWSFWYGVVVQTQCVLFVC